MNKIIEPNGGVTPTPSLLKTATEAQVRWDQAPDWAQTYSVRNSFGNHSAKWWSAIGQIDAEAGAADQNKSQDAPVYFKLPDGEPLKLVHRPITTRDDLRAAAQERVGEVPTGAVHFTGHNQIHETANDSSAYGGGTPKREGENPMAGKVSGYRKLSDAELQLVNDIKALGPLIESLIERAKTVRPVNDVEDFRLTSLARTNFQQGAMWLIRGVARPEGFF